MSAMPVEYLTPAIEDRAVEVLTLLADRGQQGRCASGAPARQRGVAPPDRPGSLLEGPAGEA